MLGEVGVSKVNMANHIILSLRAVVTLFTPVSPFMICSTMLSSQIIISIKFTISFNPTSFCLNISHYIMHLYLLCVHKDSRLISLSPDPQYTLKSPHIRTTMSEIVDCDVETEDRYINRRV